MKRILFSIGLFALILFEAQAQKEVFFTSKSSDSISITSFNGLRIGSNFYISSGGSYIPIRVGYFDELKLGATSSLILSGDLLGSRSVKSIVSNNNAIGYSYNQQFIYGFGLQLSVTAEPRWYFDFKNRALREYKTNLNSGFYVGLPIELFSNVINFGYQLQLNLFTTPSLGFRYAITNKIFVEANVGLALTPLHLSSFAPTPIVGLKIGIKL